MDTLPKEMLFNILYFCSNRDLCSVSEVCDSFYTLLNSSQFLDQKRLDYKGEFFSTFQDFLYCYYTRHTISTIAAKNIPLHILKDEIQERMKNFCKFESQCPWSEFLEDCSVRLDDVVCHSSETHYNCSSRCKYIHCDMKRRNVIQNYLDSISEKTPLLGEKEEEYSRPSTECTFVDTPLMIGIKKRNYREIVSIIEQKEVSSVVCEALKRDWPEIIVYLERSGFEVPTINLEKMPKHTTLFLENRNI